MARKSDVEIRFYRGENMPCVNVKVYGSITPTILAQVEQESGEQGFAEWAQAKLDTNSFPEWECEAAFQSAWDMLQADVEEIFGKGVKVYSEGRSGGWAVVPGLPPIESWDAIALSRWARFEKYAKAYAKGIPYDMAMLAAISTYAAIRETREKQSDATLSAESQVG